MNGGWYRSPKPNKKRGYMNPQVKLLYLSNSGFLLTTEDNKKILIDPYLSQNSAAPFGPEALPDLDLIIVSHAAFDHLGDAFELAKKNQAFLLGDFLVRELAYEAGVPKELVKSFSYGGTVQRVGVEIRALLAHHVSYAKLRGGQLATGTPLSFLLTTSEGLRIHHMGDTCLFEDLRLVGQLHRPHIGLVPVGAAAPQYGTDLPPNEAALAVQWIGCELAIPIHYCDDKQPHEFARAVEIMTPWMEIKQLKPGQELVFDVIKQGVRTTFVLSQ
jgi:L-ascorbate metabolism protein UlaG (beta-lactamase superfamily)